MKRACKELNGKLDLHTSFLQRFYFGCSNKSAISRALRLDESEAQTILEQYTGSQYQIETHTSVGNQFLKLVLVLTLEYGFFRL